MLKHLTLIAILFITWTSRAEQWLTSYSDAVKKAKTQNKVVFAFFTGSDWCGWCKRLHAEVLSKPEFARFAAERLVLLEIDFPRKKELPADIQAANEKLAAHFRVEGFPTVILLDQNGRKIGQTGYLDGGAVPYIKHLESFVGTRAGGNASAAPPPSKAAAKTSQPVIQAPPIRYDDLILKGISGAPTRRMALINNHTFSTGETAAVKLGDRQIKVLCKEIKEQSVVIEIEKQTLELGLGEKGGAAKIGKATSTAPKSK